MRPSFTCIYLTQDFSHNPSKGMNQVFCHKLPVLLGLTYASFKPCQSSKSLEMNAVACTQSLVKIDPQTSKNARQPKHSIISDQLCVITASSTKTK